MDVNTKRYDVWLHVAQWSKTDLFNPLLSDVNTLTNNQKMMLDEQIADISNQSKGKSNAFSGIPIEPMIHPVRILSITLY